MMTQQNGFLAVLRGGEFPMMSRMITEDFELDLDALFEFGLGRLLDGLERYIARHCRGPRRIARATPVPPTVASGLSLMDCR